MAKYKDITEQTFGRLKVVKMYGKNRRKEILWECECSCGTKDVIVTGINLKSGNTRSCGCLRIEKIKEYHNKRAPMKESQ